MFAASCPQADGLLVSWKTMEVSMTVIEPVDTPKGSPYIIDYVAAVDRTERLGFKAPPRVVMRKNCVDMSAVMPVLLDYFDEHSPDEMLGQTLAIHFDLIPRLYDATRIPFFLTVGWMVWEGRPLHAHEEDLIRRFMEGGSDAWIREGCPFHLWMTSPAFEILDITFAMNMGNAQTREECARRVVYQPAHALAEEFIYHPTLVGPDFFYKTGAII
jgi:hypothetical protein